MYKFFQLLAKVKGFATISCCFYDVFEFLHHTWQTLDLILVSTMTLWILVIKVPIFLFLHFNKRWPLIFNKKNSKFVLTLLYYIMVSISLSNLVFDYHHNIGIKMLIAKSIVVFVILIWEWKETEEAIKKLDFDTE